MRRRWSFDAMARGSLARGSLARGSLARGSLAGVSLLVPAACGGGTGSGGIVAGVGYGSEARGLRPASARSDQIIVPAPGGNQVRLRFTGCPFAPLVDTSEQNVCQGL